MSDSDARRSSQRARRKPRAETGAGDAGAPPVPPQVVNGVPPSKPERVRFFRQMMIAGLFITGHTVREYAEIWGLAVQTLQLDSAEASRSLSDQTDEEKANEKARWLARIEGAAAHARSLKRLEAEARFLEMQGKAQGFFEPQKVELSGSLGDLLALATGSSGEDSDEPVEG